MADHDAGWANPMPAGLTAFSIAVFIFYAMFTGKVPMGPSYAIAGIWLIGGFFVQIAVGIIELKMGSVAGGNTFTWFSAYFMLVTGSVWVFEYFAHIYGWQFDAHIAGWTWLAMGSILILEWPGFAKTMPLTVFLGISLMNLSVPLIIGINLGLLPAAQYAPIAGNLAGLTGVLMAYSAAAAFNNAIFGKAIFPLPGPIIK